MRSESDKSIASSQVRLMVALVAYGWVFQLAGCTKPIPQQERLRQAAKHLDRGEYEETTQLTRQILSTDESRPARLLLAQALAMSDDIPAAISELQLVTGDNSVAGEARHLEASLELQRSRANAAEMNLRRAVSLLPRRNAFLELATILSRQGRTWECRKFLLHQLQQGDYPVDHLFWAVRPDALHGEPSRPQLEQWNRAEPSSIGVSLGLARLEVSAGHPRQAIARLQSLVSKHPANGELQGYFGRLLFEHGGREEFLAWNDTVPSEHSEHPDLWIARGLFAESAGDDDAAAVYFLAAARLDPDSRLVMYRTGQLQQRLHKSEAQAFLQRAVLLEELDKLVAELDDRRTDVALCRRVAELCESLGRYWEARGWHHYAHYLVPDPETPSIIARLESRLRATSPITVLEGQLLEQLSRPVTIPQLSPVSSNSTRGAIADQGQLSELRFKDVTEQCGIDFQYVNGRVPSRPPAGMQDFTGGGVAVIDFDHDGHADVLLTQGSEWPFDAANIDATDQLFRNSSDGTFREVTAAAAIRDIGYGQGVTVGDFDNDGFPDLYIANIGRDQLLKNNGDGTFSDISEVLSPAAQSWSTSCGFADLNTDGFEDIYVVGYLGGSDVYSRTCADEDGIPRTCRPTDFPAVRDQVLINSGSGAFVDHGAELGFHTAEPGRGLGMVISHRENQPSPDIFIANDGEPNFFFTSSGQEATTSTVYQESAFRHGLALGGDGESQACMGVACGFVNTDSTPDYLITNFYHESNTLYLSTSGAGFRDATVDARLRQPSLPVLGFGTQFLDADLDGDADVVITNGHESDNRDLDIPYHMRPQLFENVGDYRFSEVMATTAGTFFKRQFLGRGLARIDIDSDDQPDFIVSNLDSPARVVRNTTAHAGHAVSFRFVGTRASRTAIGVTARVQANGRIFQQQLMSGDGYFASNERRVRIGIGPADYIDSVTIAWPSGHHQQLNAVVAGQRYLVVEDQGCWIEPE